MKAVAIAALVKEPSDQHLWPRILRANRCHHLAAVHEAALAAFAAPRWMAIMRLPINCAMGGATALPMSLPRLPSSLPGTPLVSRTRPKSSFWPHKIGLSEWPP
jgi:hypothetical protein